MRRFLIKLIVFLLPIVIIVGGLYANAYYIGELRPMSQVLHLQIESGEPIVYQAIWQQSNYFEYKLLGTAKIDPDMLIMGSSRMMYFRANFLSNPDTRFYNASVQAASIEQLSAFTKTVLEAGIVPDVIIVGLDLPSFNANRTDFRRELALPAFPTYGTFLDYQRAGLLHLSSLWLNEPSKAGYWGQVEENGFRYWGIEAIQGRSGFIYDGSKFNLQLANGQFEFAETFARHKSFLQERQSIYLAGSSVDMAAIQSLRDLLQLAQEHNISIVGLLPPYHPDFLSAVLNEADFDYVDATLIELETLFDEYDFPLANYMNVESFGGNGSEMQDSWHIGELASLRIYAQLLEDYPEIFAEYSDLAQVRADIENASNPYQVYESFK